MNSIYNIFNNSYIQQQAEHTHRQQNENVLKSAHKLQDFFDSLEEIKPEYRNEASQLFSAIIINYINTHSK